MVSELSDVLWRSVMFYFKVSPLIILELHSEMNVGEGSRDLLSIQKKICARFGWEAGIPAADPAGPYQFQRLVLSGTFFSSNMRGGKKIIIS